VRNHGRPSGRSSGIQAVQRATTVPQAQLARTPSQPMCAHVPRVEPLAGTHRAPPHGRGGLARPRHGGPTLTASQNLTTQPCEISWKSKPPEMAVMRAVPTASESSIHVVRMNRVTAS
jgi:hypothetical protein